MRAAKAARDFLDISKELAAKLGDGVADETRDESCRVYLRDQVLPLLRVIAETLCVERPPDAEAYVILLLSRRVGVPSAVTTELRSFLDDRRVQSSSSEKEHAEENHCVAVKSPVLPPSGDVRKSFQRTQRCRTSSEGEPAPAPTSPTPPTTASEKSQSHEAREELALRSSASATESGKEDGNEEVSSHYVRSQSRSSQRTVDHFVSASADEDSQSVRSRQSQGKCTFLEDARGYSHSPCPRRSTNRSRRPSYCWKKGGLLSEEKNAALPPMNEVIRLLRTVPVMAKLTDEDIVRVASIAKTNKFEAEETIVNFGQVSADCHIIIQGSGQVCVPQACGTITRGAVVGDEALTSPGYPSNTQVTAQGDLYTLSVNTADFEALLIQKRFQRKGKMEYHIRSRSKFTHEESQDHGDVPANHCPSSGHEICHSVEKSALDKEAIATSVKHNKMLGDVMSLDDEQCAMIADAVHLVSVPADKYVFRIGDVGTAFFIVHEGLLEIELPGRGALVLRSGDSFGELALMYDAPRAASALAKTNCRLWVISRMQFKKVCHNSAKVRLTRAVSLLKNIPSLVETVDAEKFQILADAMEEQSFIKGDNVCLEGEGHSTLFLVFEGDCTVTDIKTEKETMLRAGEWIGDKQLLEELPATYTIEAASDVVKVLALDSESFQVAIEANNTSSRRGIELLRSRVQQVIRVMRFAAPSERSNFRDMFGRDHSIKDTEVVGPLGEGSFGIVMLLEKKNDPACQYALKGISKEHLRKVKQESMVQNERRLMMSLNSNFIVRLYNSYEDDSYIYFLLEPAVGGELFDVFTENNLWGSVEHIRFYIASVASGLAHIHSRRIVWRDLKLENCLLDKDGFVKLTDFGIAKMVIGMTYTVCGTVDYFAPETLRQHGHNRAVDWWACGVLLFIMIAGRAPFDAPEVQQIYKNIIKGMAKVKFPSSCPPAVEDVIRSLCKKKPEERLVMQKGGISNLQHMQMFEGFSWEELESCDMKPLYIPSQVDREKLQTKKLSRELLIAWDDIHEWDPGQAAS
eukprot:TRINITY_DN62120_c0_g1_i1.p1 TRINITY_DN62120_c0_g1~~TRINITY_DN62120_c0_g1_i1.p1  ORF type:complete len:1083 (-),score=208.61 TRINITY_DN62120_c0_g1_i1:66-3158(-)